MSTREAAVAGLFYDADAGLLEQKVSRLLQDEAGTLPCPRALIAPHAGYIYSGAVAAKAYAQWQSSAPWRRILLLGPAHRVPFRGMALPQADSFRTPLGTISIDTDARQLLSKLPQVGSSDLPHAQEHSLEVQLPFLQQLLDSFTLIPLVVGSTTATAVAEVIAAFWDDPETGIVISSDLSHFHPYEQACLIDAATTERIERCATDLKGEEACGHLPINGLLTLAKARSQKVSTLELCNSGDTVAGDRSRVVGYGAYAIH